MIRNWRHPIILLCVALFALLSASIVSAQDDLPDDDPEYINPDTCAECHEDEYHVWEDSGHANSLTNPAFIEAHNRAGSPNYCYKCHATGYDPVDGSVDYEGIACRDCHTPATESGGPHMLTDTSAEACGTCHTGSHAPDYDQWLTSEHALADISCLDCHGAHDTKPLKETADEQCLGCHEMSTEGSVHYEEGMSCIDCHMADGENIIDPLSGRTDGAGHTFEIPVFVCSSCHGMTHTIEPDGTSVEAELTTVSNELETCEGTLEATAANKLNLGLTGGGIAGLFVGIAIPVMLLRRKSL